MCVLGYEPGTSIPPTSCPLEMCVCVCVCLCVWDRVREREKLAHFSIM